MLESSPPTRFKNHTAATLATLLAVFAFGGCGDDAGAAGDPPGPSITPLLDTDRESNASIGPDGGTVEATGADGTEYTLTLPADALVEETEISLTPIIRIDDLPMSGGFVAGVHFEPSGLELFRTAILTTTPPAELSLGADEALTGFVYDGSGENLALTLAEAAESSFSLPVDHFSGGGGGAANPAELAAASTPGSSNAFIAQIIRAIAASDTEAAQSSLREWYATRVKPRLQAAVSNDSALERALDEYRRWLVAEGGVPLPIDVSALISESEALASDAFRAAVARANDLCERQESFIEAEEALLWQRRAESVLPQSVLLADGLDRRSVLNELCVQVVFVSTFFPPSPFIGEPALLQAVVGFAFGDGPTEFSSGMAVNVLSIGANPAGATEVTDDSGAVELTLTPDSGSVEIEVDACIGFAVGAGAITGASVCQQAFIVRGLVVSPSSVTVTPGASQQFTAQLLGVDEPVTWSVTGGSIDANGLYTAGATPGTFTVTATGVANPSLVATAEVTIEEDTGEPVTSAWLGTAQCFDIDTLGLVRPSGVAVIRTGSQLEIHFPRVDPGTGEATFRTPCVSDDLVYVATLTGDSFTGSTNDCFRGPCAISGTLSGDTISGTAVWQGDCECSTDFEATVANNCAVLSSGSDPLRMSCSP